MPNYCEITSYTREVKHSRLFIIKLLFTTPHFIPVVTPLSVPLCDVITPTLAAQCRSLPMPDDVRNPRRFSDNVITSQNGQDFISHSRRPTAHHECVLTESWETTGSRTKPSVSNDTTSPNNTRLSFPVSGWFRSTMAD